MSEPSAPSETALRRGDPLSFLREPGKRQGVPCRFKSPYQPSGTAYHWLRGNHHGHSTLSDGADEPLEILAAYEAAGYDYLALSEHDFFADPEHYRRHTAMTLLPAVEVTSRADQTLMFLGADEDVPPARSLGLRQLSEHVAAAGGLFIVDHPNWLYQPLRRHATLTELLAAPDAGAIEIYTGVIERLPGDPHALDLWDELLSAGRRIFGHAVDDQHSVLDRFLGWNCVQWPAHQPVTPAGIIRALTEGRFYASTGVTIREIGLSPDRRQITIRSNATSIRWIVRDGRLAHVSPDGNACLSIDDLATAPRLNHPWQFFQTPTEMTYVRAELVGADGQRAWTQPCFIEAVTHDATAGDATQPEKTSHLAMEA